MWRLNPHHCAVRDGARRSTSTQSACAWAALGLANPCLVQPARTGPLTRARPAVRWASPRADTTRSPRWCTQQLRLVTARLRWRSLGSSLALTCGLRMFSPLPWATPALPLTSRSALRTLSRLVPTARRLDTRPNSPTLAHTCQNISYTPIVWSAYGRPHRDTLTVLRSLSKSIARNVTLSLPRLSIINFMPASPWRSRYAALGKLSGRTAVLPDQLGSRCCA